jgi:hypothetical protein
LFSKIFINLGSGWPEAEHLSPSEVVYNLFQFGIS